MTPIAQRKTKDVYGSNAGNAIVLAQKTQIAEQIIQRQRPSNRAQRQVMARQAQGNRPQYVGPHKSDQQANEQRYQGRSEARRGGGKWGSTSRSRGSPST